MKLEQGKKYYVSDASEEDALNKRIKLPFVFKTNSGKMYFYTRFTDDIENWGFAVEIPEPTTEPWTMDTAPLPPFCVRFKARNALITLDSVSSKGVRVVGGSFVNYEDLHAAYVKIEEIDGKRVELPCGVIKGE